MYGSQKRDIFIHNTESIIKDLSSPGPSGQDRVGNVQLWRMEYTYEINLKSSSFTLSFMALLV